jgi:putative colanic acid biosynthesis UDP-glucose lipid carrier transferase
MRDIIRIPALDHGFWADDQGRSSFARMTSRDPRGDGVRLRRIGHAAAMTQTLVFKQTLWIALLTLLRLLMPAIVGLAVLWASTYLHGVPFAQHFVLLSVLVVILAPIFMRQPPLTSMELVRGPWPNPVQLSLRWLVLLGVLLAIGYVTKLSEEYSRRVILTWAFVTPAVLTLAVFLLNLAMRRLLLAPSNVRRAVVAGYNEVSVALVERLQANPAVCIAVDGFFDDRSAERLGADESRELLGGLADLPRYVRTRGVDVIFVSLPMRHVQRVLDLLDELRDSTASIYYVPDVFVFDLIQSRTGELLGMPVVALCETPFFGYRGVVKRLMDLSIASLAVLALAPLLLAVALLVKLTSPGPVIFKQRRYGLDGKQIQVYKFRTMTVTEDGDHIRQATADDDRTTKVGRVLRRLSLDELPQLFNVLEGSMSLVGPRPHAVAHNEEYRKLIKGYMIRHKVLPGMTGLAQVSGCRGETRTLQEMQARIEHDLDYLRRWSPTLDLQIIARTAWLLLKDKKAY